MQYNLVWKVVLSEDSTRNKYGGWTIGNWKRSEWYKWKNSGGSIKPERSKANNKEKSYGVIDVEEDKYIPNLLDQYIDSDSEDKD